LILQEQSFSFDWLGDMIVRYSNDLRDKKHRQWTVPLSLLTQTFPNPQVNCGIEKIWKGKSVSLNFFFLSKNLDESKKTP